MSITDPASSECAHWDLRVRLAGGAMSSHAAEELQDRDHIRQGLLCSFCPRSGWLLH